jgi:hypothetical protein
MVIRFNDSYGNEFDLKGSRNMEKILQPNNSKNSSQKNKITFNLMVC